MTPVAESETAWAVPNIRWVYPWPIHPGWPTASDKATVFKVDVDAVFDTPDPLGTSSPVNTAKYYVVPDANPVMVVDCTTPGLTTVAVIVVVIAPAGVVAVSHVAE